MTACVAAEVQVSLQAARDLTVVKFSPILLRAGSISVEANTYPELHHEEVHKLKPNGDRMPGGNQLQFD